MQTPSVVPHAYPPNEVASLPYDGHTSGLSWSAVLAGAAAAAALSFILLILGLGLGMSAVSPWSYNAETMGKSTVIWLAFTQLAAAGLGGYIAGRLRIRWVHVHADEVYFRDTAHGLLAWSVATLLTASVMASAVHAVLSEAIDVGAGAVAGAAAVAAPASKGASSDSDANPLTYFSDMLLRSEDGTPETDNGATRMEVLRILANDISAGALAPDDRQYLSSLIAKRTGMPPGDAERRVDGVYARASKAAADLKSAALQASDLARKAAAYSALWIFVALLMGAFFASLCATLGGKQRDRIPHS